MLRDNSDTIAVKMCINGSPFLPKRTSLTFSCFVQSATSPCLDRTCPIQTGRSCRLNKAAEGKACSLWQKWWTIDTHFYSNGVTIVTQQNDSALISWFEPYAKLAFSKGTVIKLGFTIFKINVNRTSFISSLLRDHKLSGQWQPFEMVLVELQFSLRTTRNVRQTQIAPSWAIQLKNISGYGLTSHKCASTYVKFQHDDFLGQRWKERPFCLHTEVVCLKNLRAAHKDSVCNLYSSWQQ